MDAEECVEVFCCLNSGRGSSDVSDADDSIWTKEIWYGNIETKYAELIIDIGIFCFCKMKIGLNTNN